MKNIVVIAGGNSSEFEISVKSGNYVFEQIDENKYNKFLMHLKGRDWNVVKDDSIYPVDKNDFSVTINGEKFIFHYAYITIHGVPGENGMLQGYLDMMNVPYSGCNLLASAITFDKYTCNTLLKSYGVNIANSVMLNKNHTYVISDIIDEVGIPCFVKPNAEGSSFGVTKVIEESQLQSAIEYAFEHCNDVLIESFIEGREMTCGVLKAGDLNLIMPIAEVVPKKDFFDFEAKYDPKMADEIIPAPIPNELRDRMQSLSSLIYDILRCDGIARIDYIIRGDEIFMLEVNTTPGMTSNSFVPKMVRAMGKNFREILTRLIDYKLK